MVLAYHIVFGAYGFWLPNDPRGSYSAFVGSNALARHGRATRWDERGTRPDATHDEEARVAAKAALRYPPVTFTGAQAREIARGFADAVASLRFTILACAVLPEHSHVVAQRHSLGAEGIANHL